MSAALDSIANPEAENPSSLLVRFGPDKPLISGIAPRMRATPELVRKGIRVAVQHPARIDGLALKHYDGASFSLLRAFKQGVSENVDDHFIRNMVAILVEERLALTVYRTTAFVYGNTSHAG